MKATTESMAQLQRTGNWSRFVVFLGAATIFLTLCLGIRYVWTGVQAWPALQAAAIDLVIGSTLIINALMAIYPMAKLSLFTAACGQYIETKSFATLAFAIKQHRLFWRSWGILTVVAVTLDSGVGIALWLS